ncbi:hypothetical protein GCM10009839_64540 [Catenulispora yoronensis]|uniref:Uncharacterized protein n=1 Tax=Catenulispora yoronensis TaxID=450799 RepID=A0ABP5GKV8_9ACTN
MGKYTGDAGSGRPVDWSPLDDSDPVPGDPDGVADLGTWCGNLSELLATASNQLGGVCVDQFWKSGAGENFADLLASVAARCKQAAFRFGEARTVYGTSTTDRYAGLLSSQQAEASKALDKAQSARSEIQTLLSQRAG